MYKILLLLIAVLSTSVISCRQEDETFTPEDYQNLKLIDKATQKINQDSVYISVTPKDGDPIPPPKK